LVAGLEIADQRRERQERRGPQSRTANTLRSRQAHEAGLPGVSLCGSLRLPCGEPDRCLQGWPRPVPALRKSAAARTEKSIVTAPTPQLLNSGRRSGLYIWNFQLAANATGEVFLDFTMTRNRGPCAVCRILPNRMAPALSFEDASVLPQMPLEVSQLHEAGISKGSRRDRGELSWRALSRRYSKESCSASIRFARASSKLLPWLCTPGISSSQQTYPPSSAGSKTAVSFIPLK
jgi:hypothetical protein